ncbi:MAG: hypothetical protein EOL97_13705 [Spirochaetia bacterium]|nr:hypothetical protein [Spirochaetia bacterium]
MGYSENVLEYAKVKMEQCENNNTIAKELKSKFHLPQDLDIVRRWVSYTRAKNKIEASKQPIKRLFFDIETGYYTCRLWRIGKVGWVGPDMIKEGKPIICISYKWQGDDKVYNLDWTMGEKEMLEAFAKVLEEASEIIAHNGDRFDIKEFRTRCIYYGILISPTFRTLDTLKKSREYFSFASNKLDYIGQFLNVGRKMPHEGLQLWIDVIENKDSQALKTMIEYCNQDVILLEDVYHALAPYITHNNNMSVLTGGEKWHCPECTSTDVTLSKTYTTPLGVIRRNMKCNNCHKQYKVSNKTYMDMLQSIMKINLQV